MKIHPCLLAVVLGLAAVSSPGQTGENEQPDTSGTRAAVTLTPDQIDMLTKQLTEMEGQISKLRGDNLGQVLQKLRSAVSSNNAAMSLYIDCEKLVNVSRKDLDRDATRRMEERIDRSGDRRAVNDKTDGDPALAVRLQLQYLILSLEANETKDRAVLIPKLQSYIQELLASADKLKGRAFNQVFGDLRGGNNPVVAAFQLDRYLQVEKWTTNPADVRSMWNLTLLPWYQENKPDELTALWDQRITAEATLRKGSRSEAEYALWLQNELPALRWERAEYLVQNGTSPVNALADMLKLIKEFPGHADAPKWLEGLRTHLEAAKPAGT